MDRQAMIRNKKHHKKGKPTRSVSGDILIISFLLFIGAFMVLPFIYTISTAFKPLDEIFLFPPSFFVRNPTFSNINDLFIILNSSWVPFTRYLFNTVFITFAGTLGHVIIASLGAYVLSKHDFFGKKVIFSIIIMSLMFVGQVTYIPNYMILSKLHLINSYFSIIIPAFASPLGLFLMKQFMDGIPNSLMEAGKIDGAGELTIFWRIAMPVVKPAWMTLIIFSFQSLWNNPANLYIYKEELKTLPFALGQIISGGIARSGAASAVALVLMIVPITMFTATQNNIMETMSHSGIKE